MNIDKNSLNTRMVSIVIDDLGDLKGYSNSSLGRKQLESEIPSEIVIEIYKVWGDNPIIVELPSNIPDLVSQPTLQEEFNASVLVELAKLKAGVK